MTSLMQMLGGAQPPARPRADRCHRHRLQLRAPRRLRRRRALADAAVQREGAVRPRPHRGHHRPPRRGSRRAGACGADALQGGRARSRGQERAAFATAAVRDAGDGAEFIARAEKACGMKIEVLSGEREARTGRARHHAWASSEPDGIAGDLGGGSLELIEIERRCAQRSGHAAARRPAADRSDRRQDR